MTQILNTRGNSHYTNNISGNQQNLNFIYAQSTKCLKYSVCLHGDDTGEFDWYLKYFHRLFPWVVGMYPNPLNISIPLVPLKLLSTGHSMILLHIFKTYSHTNVCLHNFSGCVKLVRCFFFKLTIVSVRKRNRRRTHVHRRRRDQELNKRRGFKDKLAETGRLGTCFLI